MYRVELPFNRHLFRDHNLRLAIGIAAIFVKARVIREEDGAIWRKATKSVWVDAAGEVVDQVDPDTMAYINGEE
jgi:hypothetical protein